MLLPIWIFKSEGGALSRWRTEEKILSRINTLVDIHMSAKNKSIIINEYAIGVINYFIGIIDIDETWANIMDKRIRKILTDKKYHHINSSIERLYIPRFEYCR
ncbi:hypothetical protein DMUE_0776 [Dictyocoela muelleri]|nr:hypothetical protein DMUE_0776 [Dictyocoela muelleri]